MLPVTKILAEVQSDIGDLSMTKIQEGEYLDFFNDVLGVVAVETETWIVRYSITPFPVGSSYSDTYQIFIPYSDVNGVIAPDHILKIVRQNGTAITETREYSIQAISATNGGNNSFPINSYTLSSGAFSTQRDGADGFILTFATPLNLAETIVIDFVTGSPMTMNTWTPGNTSSTIGLAMVQQFGNQNTTLGVVVPDFLYSVIRYGVLYRALERLFMQGDNNQQPRLQFIQDKYSKELNEAIWKAKMPKDNNSRLQIQPINWLAE